MEVPDTDPRTFGGGAAGRLRLALVGLAALGGLGTLAELAAIRHWDSSEQLIPWFAIGGLLAATAVVARSRSAALVRAGQAVAALAAAAGLYGVLDHIASNLDAGPLDRDYGARWDSMGTLSRWWAAASGGVGPAPVLAPAVLSQIGLCLLFATIAHPVLRSAARGAGQAGEHRNDRDDLTAALR